MSLPRVKFSNPDDRASKPIIQRIIIDTDDLDFLLQNFRYANEGMAYCLRAMRLLYSEAEEELRGFFAPGEWEYMAYCLRGVEGASGRNYKDVSFALSKADLCRTLMQCRHMLAKAELCDVDVYALVDRIRENLGRLHVLVIRRRVFEFWFCKDMDMQQWCKY